MSYPVHGNVVVRSGVECVHEGREKMGCQQAESKSKGAHIVENDTVMLEHLKIGRRHNGRRRRIRKKNEAQRS